MDWSAVRIVFPSAGVHPLGLVESSLINQQQFSFCRQLLHPTSSGYALMLAIFPIDRSTLRPDLLSFPFTFLHLPYVRHVSSPSPFYTPTSPFPFSTKDKIQEDFKTFSPSSRPCLWFFFCPSISTVVVCHSHTRLCIYTCRRTHICIYICTNTCVCLDYPKTPSMPLGQIKMLVETQSDHTFASVTTPHV